MAGFYTAMPAVAALPSSLILAKFSRKAGKKLIVIAFPFLCSIVVFFIVYAQSSATMVASLVAYGVCGKLALDLIVISWSGDHVLETNCGAMASAMGLLNFAAIANSCCCTSNLRLGKGHDEFPCRSILFRRFYCFLGCVVSFFVEDISKYGIDKTTDG